VQPLAAWAQQPTTPVIGFINGTSAQGYGHFVSSFRQGLIETGYTEGQNVAIEYRWADGHYERLPALAADLVGLRVAVLVATSTPANVIAMKATREIPIVFTTSSDPVALGLVASLNRPGGNITGVTSLSAELMPKRLELLRELVPSARDIAVLINPTNPSPRNNLSSLEEAAGTLGLRLHALDVSTERDFEPAFAALSKLRADALLIGTDPFLTSYSKQLAMLALHYSVPTVFQYREFAVAGGLMSYGGSLTD
jgi:putative ABC transport system substrate-binding protein